MRWIIVRRDRYTAVRSLEDGGFSAHRRRRIAFASFRTRRDRKVLPDLSPSGTDHAPFSNIKQHEVRSAARLSKHVQRKSIFEIGDVSEGAAAPTRVRADHVVGHCLYICKRDVDGVD